MSKKELEDDVRDRRTRDEGRDHSPSGARQSTHHDKTWGEPHPVPRGPPGHYPPHYDPYIIHHSMRHAGEFAIHYMYVIF